MESIADSPAERLAHACFLLKVALEARIESGERPVLVAFVQRLLGCGCAPEVIGTARLTTGARPLRDYLYAQGWPEVAPRLAPALGLPGAAAAGTFWPPAPPWRWREADLTHNPHSGALVRLRRLCAARASLLIDVPGRAMFCVAATTRRPSPPASLEGLHAAASLVKELAGYNRVRLFSLCTPAAPHKNSPLLDAALSWEAVVRLITDFQPRLAADITRLLSL